jgi:hypothetical protein
VPQVALPASWQVPCGSVAPAATLVQAPSDLVSAQDWQAPWQAVAQQVDCEQKPDEHSAAVAQTWPLGLRPHEPPVLQTAGAAQSELALHDPLQTLTPHSNGKQGMALGVTHFPAPSQVEAAVKTVVPVGQVEPRQVVPWTYFWQLPLPSHLPSVPQDAAPASLQVPCGSDAPTATLVQVPRVLLSAHDWQAPAQALLQQMPCAQKPLPHSAAAAHEAPLVLRPQDPAALQLLGALH